MRATWLTWRIHRFESLFVAGVAILLAASLWVIASHLRGIEVDPGCWAQWAGPDEPTSVCQRTVGAWLDVNEHEAGQMTGLLSLLPILLGAILGVPVIAREAEMRTLGLAWSLEGRRWRWFLQRILPLLTIALVGGILLGIASSEMRAAQAVSPFEREQIDDIARQGPIVAARMILGFAAGLLAGAIVRRTMPALLVVGVLLVAWVGVLSPIVERQVGRDQAVWLPTSQVFSADGSDLDALTYLDGATRSPDGTITREDDSVTVVCGDRSSPCADERGNEYVALIVPFSAHTDIERTDTLVTLLLAAVSMGGALVLVVRRRPD